MSRIQLYDSFWRRRNLLWISYFVLANDLLITLPDGQIRGQRLVTQKNKTYYGFQGIPFATPPLGELRFEAPQRPNPWSGVLNATQDGKACISIYYFSQKDAESEDCLYINVYTPSLKFKKRLPVLFWIYGGSFTSGSSKKASYGPDFLIKEDVILVTFNYRLGPFGFLSTGDKAISGNTGLKDQNLALKWTHTNIARFGGDPNKITIFGQSAGGVSVALHILSKKSAGLFRAAIVESGSALTNWTIDKDPRSYAFQVADKISGGLHGNDSFELRDFLKNRTVDEIMASAIALTDDQAWPVLEVENPGAFITLPNYGLLERGKFNRIPIMIGITSEESLMFLQSLNHAAEVAYFFDSDNLRLIPEDLRPNSSVNSSIISTQIRRLYLRDNDTFLNNLAALAEFYSDSGFTRGVIKHAEMQSKYTPVYLYQFVYYGRPFTSLIIDGAEKAGHAAELPFLFNIQGIDKGSEKDVLTQNRMVKLWTNFAKYLNPTPRKIKLLGDLKWPTIKQCDLIYLNINNTLEIRSSLKKNTFPQWNKIFYTYGGKPFITF